MDADAIVEADGSLEPDRHPDVVADFKVAEQQLNERWISVSGDFSMGWLRLYFLLSHPP